MKFVICEQIENDKVNDLSFKNYIKCHIPSLYNQDQMHNQKNISSPLFDFACARDNPSSGQDPIQGPPTNSILSHIKKFPFYNLVFYRIQF